MKTRARKILRDVLSRKGRTALVSLSIMIGVFGAVTLISSNDLLIQQIKDDINPDEVAMTRLFVTVPTAGTNVKTESGEDQVLALARNRLTGQVAVPGFAGLTAIEGQVVAPVFWKTPDGEKYTEADMMAFSEPLDQVTLEPMRLVKGDWPQPGQNQIAVERRMADEYDLAVGDIVTFRPVGEGATAQNWTITATVFHPYWVDTGEENTPEQRFYASFEDAQSIAGFSGFTSYYLRYVDTNVAANQAERLVETVAQDTNYIPRDYWLDDPDNYFLIGEVQEVTNILNMLAIVALVVSGFLVTNVINTIVVEQKRQIGVLKSLGATRWDNFFIYAGVALTYGVIGTLPGVLLGIVAGSAMAQSVAPLASTLIEGFKVSSSGVIVGVVMGLFVPAIAALFPVLNGTRVSIMDAMTDLGIAVNWGHGPIARFLKLLPIPISIRQALSNVVQKKGRLLLTVITLTLAAAAFMGVFAMFTVITDEIDKLFEAWGYEAGVAPTEAHDFGQVSEIILGVEGVEDVYPGVALAVELLDLDGTALRIGVESDDELFVLGIDPTTDIVDFTYSSGRAWQDDPTRDGIVLTKATATSADKEVGDRVLVSAGGQTGEYEIIGIASYPFPLGIMKWQDVAQLTGFVDPEGNPLPTFFFVTTEQANATVKEVDAVIDLVSESLLENGITASIFNKVEEQEQVAEQMMVFNLIFQLTSGVMAAVGAIGLLTTLSMAVFERQKEIGVMRSIGAGSATIISQFMVEGILIGLLAWVLAVPLSYLLAVSLLDGLGFADFIEFSYPIWVLGLGLVGMVIIAAIASLWPSLSAARRTVSDILRYQ
jgi:putative ABC transport system permease protein